MTTAQCLIWLMLWALNQMQTSLVHHSLTSTMTCTAMLIFLLRTSLVIRSDPHLTMQAAMYQNIGNITVAGVLFDTNIATGSGGGLYQNSFAGSVQNCSFTNNRVGGSGGGLFQNNYRGNVENCVFITNSAENGGAIYQNAATGETSSTSFTGNGAEKGGAIYQVWASHPCVCHSTLSAGAKLGPLAIPVFMHVNTAGHCTQCTSKT